MDRMQDTFYAEQSTSKYSRTPITLHVNFFRKELEMFKSSLPFNIQQDRE